MLLPLIVVFAARLLQSGPEPIVSPSKRLMALRPLNPVIGPCAGGAPDIVLARDLNHVAALVREDD
jgi:hypothetical protein